MLARGVLFAAALMASAATLPAQAAVLLDDGFGTGNVATSNGPGGGFALGPGTNAFESNHVAVVGGGRAADENIYSLDTFNPNQTTMTWTVPSRARIGAAGAMIGWDQSGISACAGCGPEIWLEARDDRLVFDVNGINGFFRYVGIGAGHGGYGGGSGPLTMELSIFTTGWSFDVFGPGTSVVEKGAWVAGFAPADVMAAAGGNLSAFASVRSDCPFCGDVGTFSHVLITTPEPASVALFGIGVATLGARRRKSKN